MTDLIGRITPAWDDERLRAGLRGLETRRRRARHERVTMIALAVVAAVWWWVPREREARLAELVRFADGSTAQLLDGDSVVRPGAAAPGRMLAELDAGRARFDIVHQSGGRFRVESGPVSVEVLGTRFVVERLGERSRVTVERGRVRVAWPDGATELGVGQSGLYPPIDAVDELLREADRARGVGRPADALPPLERVVAEHTADARAPLAAFTLGRIYQELHRPREAAAAFSRAASLAPEGPLAADARARAAELR